VYRLYKRLLADMTTTREKIPEIEDMKDQEKEEIQCAV